MELTDLSVAHLAALAPQQKAKISQRLDIDADRIKGTFASTTIHSKNRR
jgi:hypothetical protein